MSFALSKCMSWVVISVIRLDGCAVWFFIAYVIEFKSLILSNLQAYSLIYVLVI